MNILNLNFVHPQYGTIFTADVDTSFTAAEMLNNLVLSGFLPVSEQGYLLALREQVMQAKQPLVTLNGLEEGAVLRIIIPSKDLKIVKRFFVKHPKNGEYAPFEMSEDENITELLKRLLTQGFLDKTDKLSVFFKGQELNENAEIKEAALPDNAYLEIRNRELASNEEILQKLQTAVDTMQAGTEKKLQDILDYLPPASAIPIDPERSVNPTQDLYESIDTLVISVFKDTKLSPPKKISLWSPIPMLILLLLAFSGIVALILFAVGVF